MTIGREGNYWEVHCDFCPEAESLSVEDYPNFSNLWRQLQNLGDLSWEAEIQKDGTWLHRCPSCLASQSQEALDMFKPKGRRK